jgi:hypothetical protein
MKEFTKYMREFYKDHRLTDEEILIAVGIRMASVDDNGNGIRLCDIPFEGDSFDRSYVFEIISKRRKKP